jgi:two-component system, LuxR family, response regulator FixJ
MSHEPLIAIVDDDESFRESVQALLQSAGRRAVAFASAEQFLASGAATIADCLILDLRMPGIDGFELHRRMRTAGLRIPTIVITALADDVSRARALAAGASAFLRKPFQPDVLLQAIDTAMRESWPS